MEEMDIAGLLAPKQVAIVGASPGRHYSGSIIENLLRHGFPRDRIIPINPKYEVVDGLTAYPSLEAAPEGTDLVVALVSRERVDVVVESARTAGIGGGLLVVTDGYAEEGEEGREAEAALRDRARAAGLTLVGPNTLGYVVPATGAALWCGGTIKDPVFPGGTAVITQSSGMINVFLTLFRARRLGMRALVSVGNGASVTMAHWAAHFATDPQVTAIGLVVESTSRPEDLLDALWSARKAEIPVVALKIGTSDLGARNAVAHTGRMAGRAEGWFALFDRLGVARARDLDDFVEMVSLFGSGGRRWGRARGRDGRQPGVALATISGGETSLMCDIATDEGLPLAELEAGTLTELRTALEKATVIGNPLDLENSRTTRPEIFWRSLETLAADRNVDVLGVRFNLSRKPTGELRDLYSRVTDLARAVGADPVVLARVYEEFDAEWWEFFDQIGVPFLLSYRNSFRALRQLMAWKARPDPGTLVRPSVVPVATAAHGSSAVRALERVETVKWLEAAGIPYVASSLACRAEEAVAACADIGFPVAVKAVAPWLVHKSDAGGVALGLNSFEEVRTVCQKWAATFGEGVEYEVQAMAPPGVEIILGMTQDPTWGPLIGLGAGGMYTEVLRDVAWQLPPVPGAIAREMVEGLRMWPLLKGVRGQRPSDVAALVEAVGRFSDAVAAEGDQLASVDLNPVIVGAEGEGLCVVDAKVMVIC